MPELTVVIPTLNESENISELLDRLGKVLAGVEWEAIFVDDDSTDNTADVVRRISQSNPRVRVLHRIGRRGLSSACMEGMMASSAPYLAVMDADLQHDESLLPRMLDTIREQKLDLVVASRNIEGGSKGDWTWYRRWLSDAGRALSAAVCRSPISDPMSGFFLVERQFLQSAIRNMSGVSFKILVDLLSSSQRPARLRELPYTFRPRLRGESKLDTVTLLEYAYLLADKLVGDFIPFRFVLFALMGLLGLVLHLLILWVLYEQKGVAFATAQGIATWLAMTLNFLTNNAITYRDLRLKGRAILRGLLTFYLACTFGALINIGLAEFSYRRGFPWYLAGAVGIVISSVWNYGMTSVLTWRMQQRRRKR
ncbi:MAG: glycosyltransferase family 2 protein [Bryobacterales bacterium]|nr:glycosyltransferase family 2 protein [Bryobacterales bacterium]